MIIERKLPQLNQCVIFYQALPITYTINHLIVDYNDFSVFCQLYIQLNSICSHLHRKSKCLQCILRRISAGSSMCKYFCHHFSSPIHFSDNIRIHHLFHSCKSYTANINGFFSTVKTGSLTP